MAKLLMIVSALFLNHEVFSQLIGPFDIINSLLAHTISSPYLQELEPPQQFQSVPRSSQINPYSVIISENPNLSNNPYFINIPRSAINALSLNKNPRTPLTSNIPLSSNSVCSPSVCKNLKNTIQLMMLSDLQNQDGGDTIALKMAAPILNDILSKSTVSSSSYLTNSVPIASGTSGYLTNSVPIVPGSSSYLPNSVPIASGTSYLSNSVPIDSRSNYVSSIAQNLKFSPRVIVSSPSDIPMSSATSDGKIDIGLLSKLLKILGGGA